MAQDKKYQDTPLGYDRTQLYKEYQEPQIRRQSALKSAMSIMESHELKLSMKDLFGLTKRIEQFIETGDTSWSVPFDNYVNLVSDERLQTILHNIEKK